MLTDTVTQLGPSTAADTFQGPIESITSNRGGAGIVLIVSVVAALWAASGYVSAFADASNSIYEVEEGRPFWKLKLLTDPSSLITGLPLASTTADVAELGEEYGAAGGIWP